MSESMYLQTNPDGSVTAIVGAERQTFDNMGAAIEWATAKLYSGDNDG